MLASLHRLRPVSVLQRRSYSRVAVVGAGPAGFYAAQHILKNLPASRVDIFEALPVPFGLVR